MDSNEIIIEELQALTAADVNTLKQLVVELSHDARVPTSENLQEMISSPSTHLYVARERHAGEIVGMVTLVVNRITDKVKGWVEGVVVSQNHRGKGIATGLLNHSISQAKRYGVDSLDLTSNPLRENANRLYVSLGFVKRDTNVYRMSFE